MKLRRSLAMLLLTGGLAGPTAAAGEIFVDVSRAAGLVFEHDNGMSGHVHLAEIMAPGAALFDFDNDGDLDLYLTQGARLGVKDEVTPGPRSDRLLRNDLTRAAGRPPEVRLTDVTEALGLDVNGYGMGVASGDFDNDGWMDLYVVQFGPNRLLRNDAGKRFVDVTARAGVAAPGFAASAAFVDYDRDGHLDLFVAQYVHYEPVKCFRTSTQRDYCGPKSYRPARDQLFRNRGDGRFEDVSALLGPHRTGAGLGVVAADLDDDGWPDIYVANDGSDNNLWINRAGRAFQDDGLLAGVALNRSGQAEASMGIALGDVDGDGDEDLFVTHLSGETNTLYVNQGGGFFEDRTIASGLGAPSLPLTGFGTGMIDYDNDGWLDLPVVNGAVRLPEASDPADPFPLQQRNQLFHNLGGGRFADVSAEAGQAFARLEVSRGLARGDVDNDGDVDLLTTNTRGPARLLLNSVGQDTPWLGVRLLESDGKRDALGTRLVLRRTGAPDLWRRVHTDGSYASAGDPRVLFGLGGGGTLRGLEAHGPDGTVDVWPAPPVGRYTVLKRGSGRTPPAAGAR